MRAYCAIRRDMRQSKNLDMRGVKTLELKTRTLGSHFGCHAAELLVLGMLEAMGSMNRGGPELATDRVHRPVQRRVPFALAVAEQFPLDRRLARQLCRADSEKTQRQQLVGQRPLEQLGGGLPERLGDVGG